MKNPLLFCAAALIALVAFTFSCRRLDVPVPAGSCFQVTRSSAAGTDSQMVAVNSPITPITYTVAGNISTDTTSVDTIHVNFSGALPPGVTTSYVNGVFTISGTPTSNIGSPFNYTVTTTGTSCNTGTISGSITVTTCGTINLTSAAGSNAQTVTVNTAIFTPIRYTLGGGATSATVTGLPPGVGYSLTGGVLIISGTPTTVSATPYSYTVTTVGGACTSTATGTITVIAAGLSTVISCGVSASNAVTFNWTAVPGATNYNIAYIINPPGSVVNRSTTETTYAVTGGLVSGDNVQITVTPVGSGTYSPQTFTCTPAAGCPGVTISYNSPFCSDGAIQPVVLIGTTGGTFSSSPALALNAGTGGITPSISSAGTYVVNYTITTPTTCTTSTLVTVNTKPFSVISYASPFSISTTPGAQAVTQMGTRGGTFSSTAGLTINAGTGVITPSTSTAGTYDVTYTMAAEGGCTAQTATTTVTINP